MNLNVKTIVAIGIGAALFFVLGRFAVVPVFANTNLSFQYAVLAFFAVLFGPIAGVLIGLIGHILIDMSWGWGIWWSWIIVSGVVGCGFGFVVRYAKIEQNDFTIPLIIRFVIGTIIVNLIGWGLIAPGLDILIYQQPVNHVFTQGLFAFVGNAVTTAVVGTLLLFAYNKAQPKAESLYKE
ncbi:MAG: ECF-type riboflavin transporter substrate-binding protein [Firmicutes bacterium]|nr:ECF-type riboflavin transporter substrate-binding protein [Bacillota bacterium]